MPIPCNYCRSDEATWQLVCPPNDGWPGYVIDLCDDCQRIEAPGVKAPGSDGPEAFWNHLEGAEELRMPPS